MPTLLSIALLLTRSALSLMPTAVPETVVVDRVIGGCRVVLTMRVAPFIPIRHRLRYDGYFIERIDGRRPYGVDGGAPGEEITRLRVRWSGRVVELPGRLYSDCYNPDHGGRIMFHLAHRGSVLAVEMEAGDGAGAYGVVWYVRRDGTSYRRPPEISC